MTVFLWGLGILAAVLVLGLTGAVRRMFQGLKTLCYELDVETR